MRFLKFLLFLFSSFPLIASASDTGCLSEKKPYYKNITDELAIKSADRSRNIRVLKDKELQKVIEIYYPKGSYDPGSMVAMGKPVGGVNIRYKFKESADCLYLSYDLMFPDGFDFVKGGKLPGLYGGRGNTGGKIPNGHDGFSTRFLWLDEGGGAVYSYLPTSKVWGTALGKNRWKYIPGRWHKVTQKIKLNTPSYKNGVMKVWIDNNLVYQNDSLTYRYTDDLKIDGILFSSFFGGNKTIFASTKNTFLDVKNIVISNYLN